MQGAGGVRRAEVRRETRETRIYVELTLAPGGIRVSTPIKFLNHMLETLIFYMNASGGEIVAEDLGGVSMITMLLRTSSYPWAWQ